MSVESNIESKRGWRFGESSVCRVGMSGIVVAGDGTVRASNWREYGK